MSDKSQLMLCGESFDPPEELDWPISTAELAREAIFKSSAVDIRDSIGTDDFKLTFQVLIQDILDQEFKFQKRFIDNEIKPKIEEVYDYVFPENAEITDETDVLEYLEFLKFVEYNNVDFLATVWRFLEADLMKIDIEDFCWKNADRIIKETEDQLESRDDPRLISIFLRTYYKEKFIEWFIKNTTKNKIEIIIEQKL